jgi:predicted flap endonuclease-1-like 5' DNA nuclease
VEPIAEPTPVAAEAEPVAEPDPVTTEPVAVAVAEPIATEPAAAEPEPVAEPIATEPVAQPAAVAEPIAVAEPVAQPEPVAAAVAASEPAAAAPAAVVATKGDNLTKIAGIGPKAAAALATAGITTYQQLADSDETALRAALTASGVRATAGIASWPERAKELAGATN